MKKQFIITIFLIFLLATSVYAGPMVSGSGGGLQASDINVTVQGYDANTVKKSGTTTAGQVLCSGSGTDPTTAVSCGAPTVDNSTASHILAKDNSSEIENLTLDDHLSLTGTTSPVLGVKTPTVNGISGAGPTAAQCTGNGCVVTNNGQAASDDYSQMPVAAENLSILYTVGTARSNKWGPKANTNDKIYFIGSDGSITAGSDNGYLRFDNAVVGQSMACWTFQTGASAYDWLCKGIAIGTGRTIAAN